MRLRRMELDLITANRSATAPVRCGGVPRREIIHFCFHLQQLLVRSGVPILEGLTDLRDSLEHPRFREVVASLIESIEGGQTLSQAMDGQPAGSSTRSSSA
jgi:type IV pilus assembly protein PilC